MYWRGALRSGSSGGHWLRAVRLATTLLYVAVNVGLVGLHANEAFFPHSTQSWTDTSSEHHHGHNHAACVVFWSSAPSPAAPPVLPLAQWESPFPPERDPVQSPIHSPWRKSPLPRGPPRKA